MMREQRTCQTRAAAKNLTIVFAVTFVLLTCVCQADAAFVNSVERFRGTDMDTATWEAVSPEGMSQDDALVFATRGNAEYTTRFMKIGVGEAVHAAVTLTGRRSSGDVVAMLALSTNTTGTADTHFRDSSYIYVSLVDYTTGAKASILQGGDGSGSGWRFYQTDTTIIDETHILEMERLTSSSTVGRIYNASHDLLSQRTLTHDSIPDDLYINLYCSGYSRWDYVAVPEPATLSLLALGGLALIRRRRK